MYGWAEAKEAELRERRGINLGLDIGQMNCNNKPEIAGERLSFPFSINVHNNFD